MDQGKDNKVADSPTEIREAIAQARADLGRHLNALSHPFLPREGDSPGGVTMSTEKTTKPTSSKSRNAKATPTSKTKSASAKTKPKAGEATAKSAKPSATSKSSSAKTKPTAAQTHAKSTKKSTSAKSSDSKRTTARKGKSIAAKAGHVIDTMTAGAVVGAVQAAAQAIAHDQTPTLTSQAGPTPTTREVLSEMAPDAALGAVVGAAHAVIPEAATPPEGTRPNATKPEPKSKTSRSKKAKP